MAQLTLSVTPAGSNTYDLTAMGTADWIDYPGTSPVHKSGGGGIIGVAHVGSFSDSVANDSHVTTIWSDGAESASGSSTSLVYSASGIGIGYSATFPADTRLRTATVIAGSYNANVQITATLSDGSAPQRIDNSIIGSSSAGSQAIISAQYAAASAGQTLTISIVSTSQGSFSNTSFQAAAVTTPAGPTNTAVSPSPAALTLTGYAPSVSRGVTTSLSPGAVAITMAGYAPAVTQGMTTSVSPAPAAISITGYAPSVSRTTTQSVSPAPAGLALTGYAPTVTRGASLIFSPGVQQITLTGYAPTISQANNVTPHYAGATILQLSGVFGVADLGPATIYKTAGFP